MNDDRLAYLISAYIDASLTGPERRELEACLRDSAAARHLFWDLATQCALIDEAIRAESGLSKHGLLPQDIASGASALPATAGPDAHADSALLPQSRLTGFLTSALQVVPGGQFTVGLLLVLAIFSAFWGIAVLVQHQGGDDQRGPAQLAEHARRPSLLAANAARVSEVTGCEWALGSEPLPVDFAQGADRRQVQIGRSLELLSGVAEMQLPSGVSVAVVGPSSLKLEDAGRLVLRHGKLLARVPRGAEGFTVATPCAEVVDLGTEFGVEVAQNGKTDVHVLRGKVEVRSDGKVSKASNASKAGSTPITLSKGQGVRVDVNGQLTPTRGGNSERFVDLLPPATAKPRPADWDAADGVQGQELFSDSFEVRRATDTINPGKDEIPGRQSGFFAPLGYVERCSHAAGTRLGRLDNVEALVLARRSGEAAPVTVSPALDFWRKSAVPLRYTVRLRLNINDMADFKADDNWVGVLAGTNEATAGIPDLRSGFGVLIHGAGTGPVELWDGTDGQGLMVKAITPSEAGLGARDWYNLRIEYTVPAFDGKSKCAVEIFVDGRRVFAHTSKAGLTHNHIVLQSMGDSRMLHGFDDLRIHCAEVTKP